MSDRSQTISKLQESREALEAYIYAKLSTLVPAQIRALRLKSNMPRQTDLARAAGKQQSQISSYETPGASNVTLETLARLASVFEVGLEVKFVPMSTMLEWENSFSQDAFNVIRLKNDAAFLDPPSVRPMRKISSEGLDDMREAIFRTALDNRPTIIMGNNHTGMSCQTVTLGDFMESQKPTSLEAKLLSAIPQQQRAATAREAAQPHLRAVNL